VSSIVVTGASGFIGRALVARLSQTGKAVVPLGRGELALADSLARLLAGADCLVHLAARAHRGGTETDFGQDVTLVQSLARAAALAGVRRFVHMSSIGVLGTCTHGAPFTEKSQPAPSEPYARAKLRGEQVLRAELASASTEWTILRPSMVYGPHAPGNFARLVHAIQRGWPLPFASVRNRRFFAGLENLLDAIELAMVHPAAARDTFIVADPDPVSTPELLTWTGEGLGIAPRLWPFPPALLHAAAMATGRRRIADSLLGDLEIDARHIRNALGWQPRIGAREGIVQAAASARS
jgi:nucleoside-diphosphate-sugar epimerase